MSISLFQHTQGIVGFQHHRNEYLAGKLIAHIKQKDDKLQCPSCRSKNITATPMEKIKKIQVLPMGKLQCEMFVEMHRIRCHDCKDFRMEKLPFTSSSHARISRAVERSIIDMRREMSIKAVAEFLGLHWGTIKDVEKKYLGKKFKSISVKDVTAIGIDEVYLGKTLGKKGFITIVRDLNSGAVLCVVKGRSSESLNDFAKKLKRAKVKINFVAVDMGPAYTAWVKEHLPEAEIVYDHFHVIKLMNGKVNSVRRRTMNELEENEKKALKGKRWHFVRNSENLNEKETTELEACKAIYSDLATCHYLKESLRNIYALAEYEELAKPAFERWMALANESQIPEMLTMAKTIKKHLVGILAYWKSDGLTSASMEGFNNKVGWLTRQAYGYRDQEYLFLKIYNLPKMKLQSNLG